MMAESHKTVGQRGWVGCALRWAVLLAPLGPLIVPLMAQKSPPPSPPQPTLPGTFPRTPDVFPNSKAPDYGPPKEKTLTFEDVQRLKFIAQRLKSMELDATKLLKLARELNAKVLKSGPESLSKEDLHTLAEMEKLAHTVKWKMQSATMANPQQ